MSIREEKAALADMARSKKEAQKLEEWEKEMEEVRTKRTQLAEQLKSAYEVVDAYKLATWREQTSTTLGVALDELVEAKLPADEALQEVLSSPLWKAKLQSECGVVAKMERGARRAAVLCGPVSGVEAAKALVADLGECKLIKKQMDEEQQGLLIGKKGVTIEKLQEETGCSLDVKRSTGTLTIAGPADKVDKAEMLIEELLKAQVRARARTA